MPLSSVLLRLQSRLTILLWLSVWSWASALSSPEKCPRKSLQTLQQLTGCQKLCSYLVPSAQWYPKATFPEIGDWEQAQRAHRSRPSCNCYTICGQRETCKLRCIQKPTLRRSTRKLKFQMILRLYTAKSLEFFGRIIQRFLPYLIYLKYNFLLKVEEIGSFV